MSIYNKYIHQLIEEEIRLALILEQEEAPEPAGEDPPDPPAGAVAEPADTGDDLPDLDAPGGTDLGGEAGEGAPGGDEMDEGDAEGDMNFGGVSGGLASFGGGSSFDFDNEGEKGITPDEEGEEEVATTIGPEDIEMPNDPIMFITGEAINMLNHTRDPSPILKNIKSSIQKYYSDFEDATPIIKALWDTEDLVLQDVARRLLLFIRGV